MIAIFPLWIFLLIKVIYGSKISNDSKGIEFGVDGKYVFNLSTENQIPISSLPASNGFSESITFILNYKQNDPIFTQTTTNVLQILNDQSLPNLQISLNYGALDIIINTENGTDSKNISTRLELKPGRTHIALSFYRNYFQFFYNFTNFGRSLIFPDSHYYNFIKSSLSIGQSSSTNSSIERLRYYSAFLEFPDLVKDFNSTEYPIDTDQLNYIPRQKSNGK